MKRISFVTSCCPEWSLETIALSCHHMGFSWVDLRTHLDGKHFSPTASTQEAQSIGVAFRKAGIFILSLSCRYKFNRETSIEEIQSLSILAEIMGARCLRVRAPVKNFQDFCRQASKAVAPRNVKLAFELASHCLPSDVLQRCFADLIPFLNVGLCIDARRFCHSNPNKWKKTLRRILSRLIICTISDDYFPMENSTRFSTDSQVGVPMGAVVQILRRFDYAGHLSIEWDRIEFPALEKAKLVLPRFRQNILRHWRTPQHVPIT